MAQLVMLGKLQMSPNILQNPGGTERSCWFQSPPLQTSCYLGRAEQAWGARWGALTEPPASNLNCKVFSNKHRKTTVNWTSQGQKNNK